MLPTRDNIRKYITYVGCEIVEWIYVVQDLWRSFVHTVMSTVYLTHYSGRVTQICVFNTVKLGTSASSP